MSAKRRNDFSPELALVCRVLDFSAQRGRRSSRRARGFHSESLAG